MLVFHINCRIILLIFLFSAMFSGFCVQNVCILLLLILYVFNEVVTFLDVCIASQLLLAQAVKNLGLWLIVPISLNIDRSPSPLLQSRFLGKGKKCAVFFFEYRRNRWQKDPFLILLYLSSRFFPLGTVYAHDFWLLLCIQPLTSVICQMGSF